MRTVLRSIALVLLALGFASQAAAGDKIWSVPGVINNGLATVFTCTNGTSAAANVKVEVFTKAGVLDATGNISAAAGATVNLATQTAAALPGGVDVNLATSTMHSGSARITVPSGVYCDAWLIDPGVTPPTSMRTLPVIKKTNQKGD